ncbi:MAG: hypothetical protein VCD33_12680, partial [Alphaproteobacteria bacterium]
MALEGDTDGRRVGQFRRRNAIEAGRRGKLGNSQGAKHGDHAAQAIAGNADLGPVPRQIARRAADLLVGGAEMVEAVHHS